VSEGSITRLLREVRDGEPEADDRLFRRVYDELRGMSAARLARERRPEGEADDLVNDAYLRLEGEDFENRRQLFFAYATTMRRLLVERARSARALKRGGPDATREPIDAEAHGGAHSHAARTLDAMAVEQALDRLRAESKRAAEVVELRFFGGLKDAEIALVLGVDERTVRRDWAEARARMSVWV